MKTSRIELWTLLFVFAFFPAAAEAQNQWPPSMCLAACRLVLRSRRYL